jgi:hypothetical protein
VTTYVAIVTRGGNVQAVGCFDQWELNRCLEQHGDAVIGEFATMEAAWNACKVMLKERGIAARGRMTFFAVISGSGGFVSGAEPQDRKRLLGMAGLVGEYPTVEEARRALEEAICMWKKDQEEEFDFRDLILEPRREASRRDDDAGASGGRIPHLTMGILVAPADASSQLFERLSIRGTPRRRAYSRTRDSRSLAPKR